jgi:site-specific DNA recombinase
MVKRPRYKGVREYKGKEMGKAIWPAVVDEVTWEVVRGILANSERRMNKLGSTRKWLLSGLAVCDVCGTSIRSNYNTTTRVYHCPEGHFRRPADLLDSWVEGCVGAFFRQEEAVTKYLDVKLAGQVNVGKLSRDRDALIERRKQKMVEGADLGLDLEDIKPYLDRLKQQADKLQDEINEAASKTAVSDWLGKDLRRSEITKAWQSATLETRRKVLADIFPRIALRSNGKGKHRALPWELVIITPRPGFERLLKLGQRGAFGSLVHLFGEYPDEYWDSVEVPWADLNS